MAGNAMKYQFNSDEALKRIYQNGFFSEDGRPFLQALIDDSITKKANSNFWEELFTVEGNEIQPDMSDTKKGAAWIVYSQKRRSTPMAEAMAPLSDPSQLGNEEWTERTGKIYQFGKGLYQNSLDKKELEAKLLSMSIIDRNLLSGYVRGVADLLITHNSRLSNMAAQVLSKGGAYSNSDTMGNSGVSATQSAYVPAENFLKAGEKVWTDPDCDIPTQMKKIEYDFKEAHALSEDVAFEWDIPYNMAMNVLLKNSYFKAAVNRYIRLAAPDKVVVITNGTSSTDSTMITLDQLVQYSRSNISEISPIRIMRESQTIQDITTTRTVSGWSPNVAVLHPLGNAGVIVHAKPADVELYTSDEVNSGVSVTAAMSQGFLYVINKVVPNGIVKAYHTDVIGSYAPVLNEIMDHVIVDTATAS